MKNRWLVLLPILAALGAVSYVWLNDPKPEAEQTPVGAEAVQETGTKTTISSASLGSVVEPTVEETAEEETTSVDEEGEPELSEEEKREAEEERLVDAFDAETDRWMEAEGKKPPTMKEVEAFRDSFRKVPKNRKDECIHRALNLIPDENVMLLVGILMDKTEDKEIVETVYNDILNRPEEVKKPVLQTIFKDKEHPCWADTAWILDVTGELPTSK